MKETQYRTRHPYAKANAYFPPQLPRVEECDLAEGAYFPLCKGRDMSRVDDELDRSLLARASLPEFQSLPVESSDAELRENCPRWIAQLYERPQSGHYDHRIEVW